MKVVFQVSVACARPVGPVVPSGPAAVVPQPVERWGNGVGPRLSDAAVTRDGRGDAARDAASAVFSEHYERLAGWVASLTGDRDVAHEIAAEAFTRLLSRWSTVQEPRGYLYVIAANLVRDRWRKLDRERRAYARTMVDGVAEQSEPPADPGLRDLVERLPERLRMPVLLHYYADLPVAEVARVLHRPEGTVKRNLYDARARLLSDLQEPT